MQNTIHDIDHGGWSYFMKWHVYLTAEMQDFFVPTRSCWQVRSTLVENLRILISVKYLTNSLNVANCTIQNIHQNFIGVIKKQALKIPLRIWKHSPISIIPTTVNTIFSSNLPMGISWRYAQISTIFKNINLSRQGVTSLQLYRKIIKMQSIGVGDCSDTKKFIMIRVNVNTHGDAGGALKPTYSSTFDSIMTVDYFMSNLVVNIRQSIQITYQKIIIKPFTPKQKIKQMDNLLRQKITQLTSKCQILQKNGKFAECIDIMQEIVSIKKSIYGIDHPQFDKASEKLCQYLNMAAMVQLQKEEFQATIDHLRKAELVARNSVALKSTTFNNMACYYRRTGKVRTALSYLIQALQLQLKIDQPKTLADTHLNLCAVLSQLDRHEDALQHSMLSIILLQDEFLGVLLQKYRLGEEGSGDEEINDERLAVLAIAYHNLGVEFQHLKRFEEALKIYKKALKFSKDNLSNNEQLVKNLTRVVNSATEQIQEQKHLILVDQKSGKLEKGLSEQKKQIYKQLSKTVQRYRHLPKLRFNSKQHASLLASYEPSATIDPMSGRNREFNNSMAIAGKTNKSGQKGFQLKKLGQTRYKIGMMDTPSSRGQMDSELKVREGMGTRTNKEQFEQ